MSAPEILDRHDGQISYRHTDPDLPPVAVLDRSPIGLRHKLVFAAIAAAGALAWAFIAGARGETVNAVWFVIAALCTAGVQNVALTTPAADIEITPAQAPYCTGHAIALGGYDE